MQSKRPPRGHSLGGGMGGPPSKFSRGNDNWRGGYNSRGGRGGFGGFRGGQRGFNSGFGRGGFRGGRGGYRGNSAGY